MNEKKTHNTYAMPLGVNASEFRTGGEYRYGLACGWQYTKLSLWCLFPYCSFVFLLFGFVFSCSRWSFVDVPLIYFCAADHVDLESSLFIKGALLFSVNSDLTQRFHLFIG